jgi:hypothetical protein
MSAATDRLYDPNSHDPNSVSFYAPRGTRTVRLQQVSEAATSLAATAAALAPQQRDGEGEPYEELVGQRLTRSLDPVFLPEPPSPVRTRSWLAVIGRLVVILSAAAVAALIATGEFTFSDLWRLSAHDAKIDLALSSRPAPLKTADRSVFPRLIVHDSRVNKGHPAPLGVEVQQPADGAIVTITGLAAAMTLSTGGAVGADAWRVPVADLGNVWIHPPKDFEGSAELVVELRLADNTIADRRMIHLEWMPPAQPKLDREEIAVLLKRGKDLLANGDLAAARLVLLPAAEADDADAALALAATYDPFVLRKLAVHGFSADTAMARTWYEKARRFGSAEAPQRLDALANGAR